MLKKNEPRRPILRISLTKIFYCGLLLTLSVVFLLPSIFVIENKVDHDIFTNVQRTHDPYVLHKRTLPIINYTSSFCEREPGTGEEGPAGLRGLYKIKKALTTSRNIPKIRLLCMVYSHSNRHDVVRSIALSYGRNCDGFWVASNLTDATIGASSFPHTGEESYRNMYNKIRGMWFYAFQNYIKDFDWFHIGGDDMFVIPENIKRLAAQYDTKTPTLLGASIPNYKNPKRRYCGGGAGYTLNAPALHHLVQRFTSGECPEEIASDEDVRVSRCLEDIGVKCQDTNDEVEEVRYHHLDVQYHAAWIPKRKGLWNWEKLQFFHNIRGNQTKLAQISKTSTTFHLDKSTIRSTSRDRGMRRYHAILWDLCGQDFAEKVERAAKCGSEEMKRLRAKFEEIPKVKNQ